MTSSGTGGPYIAWTNYGYEGWQPTSFSTLEKALRHQGYGGDAPLVTKLVTYTVTETTPAEPTTSGDRNASQNDGGLLETNLNKLDLRS